MIETEIKKIKLLDGKGLQKPKTAQKAQLLQLTVTYNHTLNKTLEKTFSVETIIAFFKNKSLEQLIGGSTIQNDKNIKKSNSKYEGKRSTFKSGIQSLSCLQVQKTHSFCRQQNGLIFMIF